MARIGVSITKSTSFRLSTQEFSNVYFYDVTGTPTQAQADTFIDNLTAMEKTFHATNVTFVRGRCWTTGGSKAENNMISQKTLSGTGAKSPVSGFDKERAILFRLRAGNSSNGQPVYLRKWYHPCGYFSGTVVYSSAQQEQTAGFSAAERTDLQNMIAQVGNANGSPLAPTLVAESGRQPTAGSNWQAHQFLEHHQFGDQWRAQ